MTQQGISSFSSNSTRVTSGTWRRRVVARQVKGARATEGFGTPASRKADQRRPRRRKAIKDAQKRRDISSGRRPKEDPTSIIRQRIIDFNRKKATRAAADARGAARRRRSRSTGRFIK